ncbi:hypothetical protein ACH9L7_00960 [Haloferax sp. S1W]|uniref:hypothetical protein n=1 Tax=Haloferax sp. S1W TaxID=3377110 RepID=UPI0037C7EFD0
MSDTSHEYSTEPPDFDRRKTTLFCHTCGRAAHLDDWPTDEADEQVQRIDCPDCGTTVWRGMESDDEDTNRTLSAPTP